MSSLTDIQDNIEKLRSLQESLHDLCTFISTLDLTSGAKEDTLIHGITELKEAFANIDLSSVEQAIADVKNAVTNIDFSALAKEATLLAKVAELKEALNSIDFTAIEQAIQGVEDVTAKEATLIQGVADVIAVINNIDFTDLEDSIAEVKNAVVNIDFSALAKEDTLTQVASKVEEVGSKIDNIDLTPIENKVDEGVSTLSDKIDNIDLSAVENKVQEESAAIQRKIDNIKLPEIDTTELAKQGENQEATNSAIYALLSQFGESVLQEDVTIVCNCAEDIAWEEYGVVITYADGTSQSLPMSENGTCSFSVKIGQEYSVQLPVIGAYIAPTKKTYTASTSSRQIYWSYVVSGVFGLDEQGRRYTIEQIEALKDKSIIKYGGYTDEFLENSSRDDGGVGNGFMWEIEQESITGKWANDNIAFGDIIPKISVNGTDVDKYANGESYTKYILSEGIRLTVPTPAATICNNRKITINQYEYKGFLPSYIQIKRLCDNKIVLQALYAALGKEVIPVYTEFWWTSMESTLTTHAIWIRDGGWWYYNAGTPKKDSVNNILICYKL